jgi:hypothetical protein
MLFGGCKGRSREKHVRFMFMHVECVKGYLDMRIVHMGITELEILAEKVVYLGNSVLLHLL